MLVERAGVKSRDFRGNWSIADYTHPVLYFGQKPSNLRYREKTECLMNTNGTAHEEDLIKRMSIDIEGLKRARGLEVNTSKELLRRNIFCHRRTELWIGLDQGPLESMRVPSRRLSSDAIPSRSSDSRDEYPGALDIDTGSLFSTSLPAYGSAPVT
ncbi:hypothetical protein NA57DRAFT_56948 [Rhizodiscina lignyota]|uniref:Uncharacterized protein n=1 Tax=Rhizodiscina lignyota TaxID=1504668 RepID=A0A9P4M5F3_9PEZI|nr:hypothetical protein NA57DRAFT_56948 [Rhizodiscina lignyota]